MARHKYCLQVSWTYDSTNVQEFFFCVEEGDVYDSLWAKHQNNRQMAINEYAEGLAQEFLIRGSVLLPKHGNFKPLCLWRVKEEHRKDFPFGCKQHQYVMEVVKKYE